MAGNNSLSTAKNMKPHNLAFDRLTTLIFISGALCFDYVPGRFSLLERRSSFAALI